MRIFKPRLRWISIFVLTYMCGGMAAAMSQANMEFLYYGLFLITFIWIITFIDRRIEFSPPVLWGLALWGFFHLAGGIVPIPEAITEPGRPENLYNMRVMPWLPKFDQLVHAFGFAMVTLVTYEAMCAHFKMSLPITLPIGCLLLFTATGLGATNEVIEFIAVLLMPETNVGGYHNTGWDMVSNAVGSMLMIMWIRARRPI